MCLVCTDLHSIVTDSIELIKEKMDVRLYHIAEDDLATTVRRN